MKTMRFVSKRTAIAANPSQSGRLRQLSCPIKTIIKKKKKKKRLFSHALI